ncbi:MULTISPECIES: alpha-L-fucosidase [Chryseobacterium]|uniref:alpha-L-fucosidase n=1 Tax=Chryseobacterium camelliae TaxID=1265445 RepID=A0ABU0TIB3_9FLAO|nr:MULTISPECIES: alpha-L-fucosidase [Chryseobacterium]MDT3409359.1 alpha-L-fucosidase [Pseudacidovorax intermedius]MDQ1096777.1 alpha-L-fucosidase [Chryseobacterium camelliae]MDQ1100719.1 alpha-L-fucosidase [Chryseobacterium sp. SORGH_AS_1048]MDR6088058.1 alpha-L-fucosidase [Chryseobacterium sp. SORGH_AS_0909]MDR6132433.1 alpha-L-fucosidase [Chryseobacterium sp. SORGH_AS_1175]
MIGKCKTAALFFSLLMGSSALFSQAHNVSEGYQKPDDPLVVQNLEQWQDLKFGLFMHWGTYSQWGIVESWSLCPEDESWTQRKPEHGATYNEYVANYEHLQATFNPVQFNPKKWADAAKKAGMKYVVFTTKHHDGFAMFDTEESDYKITSPKTLFSKNPKADVTKEIFNTFRADGFKIGAYFSKPDWHSDDYWWPYFPPKDRNVNYDPKKYPERWENFKKFTFNQLNEITSKYGKIDILWLDGGWVRPFNTIDPKVEWQRTIKVEQDIDMDKIGTMARRNQPGIIIVDRTVPGKWENYVTPEQAVPEHALSIPWESCITMGDSFSYVPNDRYKSSQKIIETLIKIISRGGNYLMNIAPGPNGDYDPVVYERLKEIAGWMDVNQSAVFATRSIAPYHDGQVYYTRSKDGKTVNVFHIDESSDYKAPSTISFTLPELYKPKKLKILGTSSKIRWRQSGNQVEVTVPKDAKFTYSTVIQMTES